MKRSKILLNVFLWKTWIFSHKIFPIFFRLLPFYFWKSRVSLIKKISNFFKKTIIFKQRKNRFKKMSYFYIRTKKLKLFLKNYLFLKMFTLFYLFILKRLKFFFIISFDFSVMYKFISLEFLFLKYLYRYFLLFYFKKLKKKSLKAFYKKFKFFYRKKKIYKKIFILNLHSRKFKFFKSFLTKYFFDFSSKNPRIRKRKFFLSFFKKSKNKIFKKKFWFFVNFKKLPRRKPLIILLLNWSNFFSSNFTKSKKKFKKKKTKISSIFLNVSNKNLILFLNVVKLKKKPFPYYKRQQLSSSELLLLKLNNHKSLNKIYKHLNNTIFSLHLLQFWFKFYNIPLTIKIFNNFSFSHKGWSKLFKIFRKNFIFKKYTNSPFFSTSLLSTVLSIYYRNPLSLTSAVCDSLEKQWTHRKFLFFTYFIIMGVLWQFALKKVTSFKKVKTVYITIRGKINSRTRTKYFQIKSLYKPSFLTLKNHLSFTRSTANARTGSFGVQSWFHY